MKPQFRVLFTGLAVLLALASVRPAVAQTHTPKYVSMSSKTKGYYEYLPEGYSATGTTTYPLLLFITGIGEFGDGSATQLPYVLKNGVPKLIQAGTFPKSFTVNSQTFRFIVITPQFIKSPRPTADDIEAVLNYIVAHYKVNTSRIYITGLSYGGGVTWGYPGNNNAYAKRIAAIVPVAGAAPDGGDAVINARSRVMATNNVPVWAFHNLNDPSAPVATTNTYITDINKSPAPTPLARKTIFNVTGHDAWTKAYSPSYKENNLNVYQWMLQYSRTQQKTIQVNVYGGTNAFNSTGWNNWNVGTTAATNKTSTSFKYSTGSTSTVSAVLSDTRAIGDNGSTYGSGMAPTPVLRYSSNSTVLRKLTLRGLSTTKLYTLELYASRNSSTAGNTIFTIGSVSKTISAVNNYTNRAVFTNLKANASGQIVVSINKSATYNYLNGFTLIETGTVSAALAPEITSITTDSALMETKPVATSQTLRVFPNPSNGQAVLSLQDDYRGAVRVQLADAGGRIRKTWRFEKVGPTLQQSLALDDMPTGLYFIVVQQGGQRRSLKLSRQ